MREYRENTHEKVIYRNRVYGIAQCPHSFCVCGKNCNSPFVGDPEETYYMVTFVSGVEYWFPVYEMFKQAGQQLGVKTVYTGTPEYDVNKHVAVFE